MLELFTYSHEFLLVIFAMLLAVASPGPDFAMVLKQSITYGQKSSIFTSIGIGLGIGVHVIYTLLGIGLIISKSIILFNIIKFLGAGYLIYIGYKSLKSKGFKIEENKNIEAKEMSNLKALSMGFLCNALNPKATLFFISLFTVIISIDTPLYIQAIYGLSCIFEVMLWFVFLSIILSQKSVRNFFKRFGIWFDRFVGGVLILIGIKIAFSK
jgi:RhtB (resistance to homoserine/threonine) family protein